MSASKDARARRAVQVQGILEPRSVAVVGASDDVRKPGARVLRNILAHGYSGDVFPVSVRGAVIQGMPSFPSVSALPLVPEMVVISIPIGPAIKVFAECARLGVPTVVMLCAVDGDKRAHYATISAICEAFPETRLIGPSSLGVHGARAHFAGSFMTATDGDFEFGDSRAFVLSQSGGVGAYVISAAHSLGMPIAGFVSSGTEVDVSMAELVRSVIDHYAPTVIFLYLEGARDEASLGDALAYAEVMSVPVLLLRGGSSLPGRSAAERHSGLPAFSDQAWSLRMDPTGARTVHSIEEMVDAGRALAAKTDVGQGRVTVVSASGGAGILMADAAVHAGLTLAEWTPDETRELAEMLPPHSSVRNPIDATGAIFSPMRTLGSVVERCVGHQGTDVTILTLGNMPDVDERLFGEVSTAAQAGSGAFVVVWAGGSPDAVRRLAERGVVAFSDPLRCARALQRVRQHSAKGCGATAT